jgi:hypothetical protein
MAGIRQASDKAGMRKPREVRDGAGAGLWYARGEVGCLKPGAGRIGIGLLGKTTCGGPLRGPASSEP